MKKLSLLLALIMVLSFAGCTKQELDAYTLYTKMQTSMVDVKSFESTIITDMKIQSDELSEDMSMTMAMQMQCIMVDENNIEMAMSIEDGDGASAGTYYYKDGAMYFEMMGMKFKALMDMEDMAAFTQVDANLSVPELAKEYIVTSAVEERDGDYYLALTVKSEMMSEVVDKALASVLGELGDVDVNVSDIEMEIVIGSDNTLKQQNMKYTMSMTVEGVEMTVLYDMRTTYTSFNTLTEIAMPDDLDSYTEIAM